MLKNTHLIILALVIYLLLSIAGISILMGLSISFLWLLAFLAFNIFNIRHTLFVKSISRIKTNEKIVFLTFDDGPNQKTTEEILAILEKFQIKACFFCIGDKANINQSIMKKIDSSGHIIGNHTQSHQWKDTFKNVSNYVKLVDSCSQTIFSIIEKKPLLFRPPYGITNPTIACAIQKLKLTIIGWNIRSLDTVSKDKNKLLSRIIVQLKPGSIILLHDSMPITVSILPELIKKIHANDYKILSLLPFIKPYA
jgi:peptidoglycan/xylan/chitin deacetylase (PgdA/CDA1 family)